MAANKIFKNYVKWKIAKIFILIKNFYVEN